MQIIKRMRRQRAVYWQRLSADKFGQFSYAAPVEIRCRWDDRQEEFRNPQGEIVLSRSVVYPDREMQVGDRLMEGLLDSGVAEDPNEESGAAEIQSFEKIPNLRASKTLYIAHL